MKDDPGTPLSKFARTRVAGVTAAKIGAKRLGLLSKRPFLSHENYRLAIEKHENDSAEALFKALTRLRGTALKMAQILSLEMGFLPEAYSKELQKSHYRVPPLNRAVVRKLIINELGSELGKTPEEIFSTFEADAFAAASLGQVHRATSKQGAKLAVKVQYPGMDRVLKNDLELVKNYFVPFLRSDYITRATEEIETRLIEEIDYNREGETTEWFRKSLKLKNVIIPKLFPEFSSKAILSTEFISGLHLDQWLETSPSQEEKDQAAQTLWDLFAHCFFELGRMHCDSNPGNYLFLGNGKIGLIDFGAVRAYDAKMTSAMARLWRGHIRGDRAEEKEMYIQLGVKGEIFDARYEIHYKPFGDWIALPFQKDSFDFKEHPSYAEIGLKVAQNSVVGKSVEGFTSDFVMLDRNLYGLFRIFGKLGAKLRFQNEWLYR